jgi:hypothetical protein
MAIFVEVTSIGMIYTLDYFFVVPYSSNYIVIALFMKLSIKCNS